MGWGGLTEKYGSQGADLLGRTLESLGVWSLGDTMYCKRQERDLGEKHKDSLKDSVWENVLLPPQLCLLYLLLHSHRALLSLAQERRLLWRT